MKRFNNILYLADCQHQAGPALSRAISLVDANQARWAVMDVLDEYQGDPDLEQRLGIGVEQLIC